jgi:hypothetical protein
MTLTVGVFDTTQMVTVCHMFRPRILELTAAHRGKRFGCFGWFDRLRQRAGSPDVRNVNPKHQHLEGAIMKAVVYKGAFTVAVEDVPRP